MTQDDTGAADTHATRSLPVAQLAGHSHSPAANNKSHVEHACDGSGTSVCCTKDKASDPRTPGWPQGVDVDARLGAVVAALTWNVYEHVCMGLFGRHRLMFAFQLAVKVLQGAGGLDAAQLAFFMRGNLSLEPTARAKPHAWLPDQAGFLVAFCFIVAFVSLVSSNHKTSLRAARVRLAMSENTWDGRPSLPPRVVPRRGGRT